MTSSAMYLDTEVVLEARDVLGGKAGDPKTESKWPNGQRSRVFFVGSCPGIKWHQEEISGKMHKSEADCLSLLCIYVFFWESGCFP